MILRAFFLLVHRSSLLGIISTNKNFIETNAVFFENVVSNKPSNACYKKAKGELDVFKLKKPQELLLASH